MTTPSYPRVCLTCSGSSGPVIRDAQALFDAPGSHDERGCFDVGFSKDGSLVVGCMEDSSVIILDGRQVCVDS